MIDELPNVVLIGLPASESANALIIPAAGHECGHSVWVKEAVETKIQTDVQDNIIRFLKDNWSEYTSYFPQIPKDKLDDLIGRPTWAKCYDWSIRQIEEMFCDFIGLILFGQSYLHAFAYLLAPALGGQRHPHYPNISDRVQHLTWAAGKTKVHVPEQYKDRFAKEEEPKLTNADNFLLKASDRVTAIMIQPLWKIGRTYCKNAGLDLPSSEEIERISQDFKLLVPSSGAPEFVDIINAGWRCYLDDTFWEDVKIESSKRRMLLNELILKTVDVLEFELLES